MNLVICNFSLLILSTAIYPEEEQARVHRIFELEFRYARTLLDWDRVDFLYDEEFKAIRSDPKSRSTSSLSSGQRSLYSSSLRYIAEVVSIVPEYSNPVLECVFHVKLDKKTEVLRWSFWKTKPGVGSSGHPPVLDLVFRDKELVVPTVCINKVTSLESAGGKKTEFKLTVNLNYRCNQLVGKVVSREEAVYAAQEAIDGDPLLKTVLKVENHRKPLTRFCCDGNSVFWIVWFHSIDGSVQHRTDICNAWLSDEEEINFFEDVNQFGECFLRAFPVLVRENGDVNLGIPKLLAEETNTN